MSIIIDFFLLDVKIYISQIESIRTYYDEIYNRVILVDEKKLDEKISKVITSIEKEYEANSERCYEETCAAISEFQVEEEYTLDILKYQTLCMFMSLQYQMWNQQLSKFALEQKYTDDIKKAYGRIGRKKELFKDNGYDFETIEPWGDIDILRMIVNVIKHGDGISFYELEKADRSFINRDNYSAKSPIDVKQLNINKEHFERFNKALQDFWRYISDQENKRRELNNATKI